MHNLKKQKEPNNYHLAYYNNLFNLCTTTVHKLTLKIET